MNLSILAIKIADELTGPYDSSVLVLFNCVVERVSIETFITRLLR